MAKAPYQGRWQRTRFAVLARDGYRCQVQGPGCTRVATDCDHLDKPAQKDAPPHRLRAACAHCNRSDGARWGNQMRQANPSRDWYA